MTLIALAVLVALFIAFANVFTDVLWFQQVGFAGVLFTQWIGVAIAFVVGFLVTGAAVFAAIRIAYAARPVYARLNAQLDRYQSVLEPLRRVVFWVVPIVVGIFAGVALAPLWKTGALALNAEQTGVADPQFGLDASFYMFTLPALRLIVQGLMTVLVLAALAALATGYLYGAIRVSGKSVIVTKQLRVLVGVLAVAFFLLLGANFWLDQYSALNDASGRFAGATYTGVNAVIPARVILAIAAGLTAITCLVAAVTGRWRFPVVATALLIVSNIVAGSLYPSLIQTLQVRPSENVLEREYQQRNIDMTRYAYNVDNVSKETYAATTDAARGQLRNDAETTANLRIIDPDLVGETFGQLQQIKQYYQFNQTLDVDRYRLDDKKGVTDAVVAVRNIYPEGAGTNSWVNDTVLYTHGYGLVAAYGNQRTSDGRPVFLEGGIPTQGDLPEFEPRVYFGEKAPLYSIVGADEGSDPVEVDFPANAQSQDEQKTTFKGDGGPKLSNVFLRLLYGVKFGSEQIVLSQYVNDSSQILYKRDPRERIKEVAPYLEIDNDTYPTVIDGRMVYLVDGYTTSDKFPYSQPTNLDAATGQQAAVGQRANNVNYIRNSVKATVDAYDGKVTLYAWDEHDPVLKTWQKIYPTNLKAVSEMSADLLSHVRYPEDLFKVQRQVLGAYHVTDAATFLTQSDAWRTPANPTRQTGATVQANDTSQQPPYYLTMKMPNAAEPAYSIYSTYIPNNAAPNSTARNVLKGYLSANSDAGRTPGQVSPDYGKLTLLEMPNDNIPAPAQVQNNITTNNQVATELNILRQGDTEVLNGNLLTVPVGGGLLYVQPVYIKAKSTDSYPLLRRVLVSWGGEIAFEDSLDAALNKLFGGDSGVSTGDVNDTGGAPVDPNAPGAETNPATPGNGSATAPAEARLKQALADADAALKERTAAYAANDLVKAGQADVKLQEAVKRALAAQQEIAAATGQAAPAPTTTP